ncbi:secreted protein, partial [marine sediment metagenome]
MRKLQTVFAAILLLGSLSGCTALDIKPWTAEEVLGDVISSTISGNKVFRGNCLFT